MAETTLFHIEIANGDTALTSTSYADVAGWVCPPITYSGKPIRLELHVPSVQNTTANALTSFRVLDQSNVEVLTLEVDQLTTGARRGGFRSTLIPKGTLYKPAVDSTLTFKVQAKVSTGTSTVRGYFNNATFGTTPIVIRAVEL